MERLVEIKQNIVRDIFSMNIMHSVARHFLSDNEISPVEDYDFEMTYRLCKANYDNVNLELFIMTDYGYYFYPVAVYSKDGSVKIVEEYYQIYKELTFDAHEYSHKRPIKEFTVIENAIMAIFSMMVVQLAEKVEDAKILSNGMQVEIFKVEENVVNIFVADFYGLEPNKAIAVFTNYKNGNCTLNPTIKYAPFYNDLIHRKLISLEKREKN